MSKNERLRQSRIERNWRQQDVADQLGVALVTMQRWERGYQQPSAYCRVKLCALFGLSARELGLLEALPSPAPAESEAGDAVQADATPSGQIALWTVPYARNPHFTGRDDLLDQLMQQFSPQEAGQPTSIRQAALTQSREIKGLGGVGKTQIAVEYAYRAHEQGRYTHTLWINAASEEAILTSFVALINFLPAFGPGGETDQRKLVASLIRWLQQFVQPWLLIFDNAHDLSFTPSYLPARGNGSLLFTTRAAAVGALASSVEVDCMSLMEGTQLLLRRAQREASDSELAEATTIVVALAHFPLAPDQAGACIEETGCSLHDYFQIYQKHRFALLARRGKQAAHYPESVATTWSLSFQHVEETNPAAAELLRLCAFLAPDHIPEELLTQGAPYWPAALQQGVADRLSFNQLLETLLSFSLVKRLSEDHLLSIHRLVQVVQMERLSPGEQRQWAERLVQAVHVVFPRDPKDEVAVWPQCQRYLEQVQACDTLIGEHHLLLPEAAELLERTGIYLCDRALYSLAEPLYLRALRIREQRVGETHPQVAIALNGLAQLYYEQGKYTQAEPLHQRALRILEQQVEGEHDPPPMVIQHIGVFFVDRERGEYGKAELLSRRALRIGEQRGGETHPQGAFALNGLAILYPQQGRYEEAEPLYQRALRVCEQSLEPEHSKTADVLHDFAGFRQAQGQTREAAFMYQRALVIRERVFGSDHPITTETRERLQAVLAVLGRTEEAAQEAG